MAQENAAQFSLEEQGRILYHLGYGVLNVADFLAFGVPGMTEPQFLVASAVTRVPESRAQNVRRLITVLDGIEQQMIEAQAYLVADKVDEITIRGDAMDAYRREYKYWAQTLADTLMVTLNPFSARFVGADGRMPLNLRVVHS